VSDRWQLWFPARAGTHLARRQWGSGAYRADFVRVEGHWKIKHLRIGSFFATPYEDGSAKTPFPAASRWHPDDASLIVPPLVLIIGARPLGCCTGCCTCALRRASVCEDEDHHSGLGVDVRAGPAPSR